MAVFFDKLCYVLACTSPKDDQVHQRVCAETVGSMYRDTGHLARCIETRLWRPLWINHHTALDIGRDATHRVVCGRLDGYRLRNRLDTEVVAGKVGDIW